MSEVQRAQLALSALSVQPDVKVDPQLLQQAFGLDQFRVGQVEIIEDVLSGRDVMAVLPTGGGKSLCYQYLAIARSQLVIVISPLIALMRDQVESLKRKKIPAGALYSGQSDDDKREVFRKLNEPGPFVLYLSPERAAKDGFKTWIKNRKIAVFAVDEAHCVSQWGHDFREEYTELSTLKKIRPDVPVLALTASATPTVLSDIERSLELKRPVRHVFGFYRPNLYYQVESCTGEAEKQTYLLSALRANPSGRILIYCGTRKQSEVVAQFLKREFSGVGVYHAGLSSAERTLTQSQYISGDLRILVATNAFGMGIDQADVRLVVHYQMPANIDSLYQEMGRAGRDGQHSTCLLLYAKADKGLQGYFITAANAPKAITNLRWRNLETLVDYVESSECRHAEVLAYYQDRQRITRCGHCDVCDPDSNRRVQWIELETKSNRETGVASNRDLSAKTKTKTRRGSQAPEEATLDQDAQARFQKLKAWRAELAKKLQQPAFVILSDKSLRDLARKDPITTHQLFDVYGLGPAKVEKFGSEILAILSTD